MKHSNSNNSVVIIIIIILLVVAGVVLLQSQPNSQVPGGTIKTEGTMQGTNGGE